jgi:hypothetical protein
MERKTLKEMRAIAADAALQHGHRISDWRPDDRSEFCFTSSCKNCHSEIQVKHRKLPPDEAQRIAQAGILIVRDTHAFSSQDYIIAIGSAVILSCWDSRPGQCGSPPGDNRGLRENRGPVPKIGIEDEIERLIQELELGKDVLAEQDEAAN